MWESESETYGGVRDRNLVPEVEADKHDGLKPDGFIRRDQSWYVSSDIPSDLIVKVGELTFHLHKYPLLSRSGKMNRIIYDTSRELEPNVVVELNDLPGGYEAFELAAKFCYGIAVDLTATNIAGLRCAAEYLEMTEDLEEGNLIFKTEAFLSYVVLSSWRDSIVVLKSCEGLSPWAENLQIVRRCSESIAWKACANPRGIRWAYGGRPSRTNSPKWAAAGGGDVRDSPVPADWWFEDVSILRIDHFVRVVTAIKVKGMRHELIGAAIMQYAAKWLPGLVKDNNNFNTSEDYSSAGTAAATASAAATGGGLHMIVAAGTGPTTTTIRETEWTGSAAREQRMVVESLISIIPPQRDSVTCGFLLRLLRQASLLKVAPALVTELEKRVGMQLEQASLSDLMIPAYYSRSDTMLDVDLVQRLVEHFVVQEQTAEGESSPAGKHGTNAKMRVARLIDSYLTEVSRDRNLSLTKFQVLAEALPDSARSCDDGLYRAVDSYLKAHPTLTEHERKRLCRVMDCQKLSMDACMHAAQNERLPLRVVVQVLFSEQVKISNAIANSTLKDSSSAVAPTAGHHYQPIIPTRKQLIESTPQSFQEGWAAAKKDINTLKFELESMKNKYAKLQNEMDGLQRQFDKMTVSAAVTSKMGKHGPAAGASGWTSGWKKFSRLTKMGGGDGQEQFAAAAAGGGGVEGEGAAAAGRKGTRRWRNSIS